MIAENLSGNNIAEATGVVTCYQGRPTGPARGFMFSVAEMQATRAVPLLGRSYGEPGRYTCILVWGQKTINVGVFDTAEECNSAWLRAQARRKIKARKPSEKGYTLASNGQGFKVNLYFDKKSKYIGTFATEAEARAKYLKAFKAESRRLLALAGEV